MTVVSGKRTLRFGRAVHALHRGGSWFHGVRMAADFFTGNYQTFHAFDYLGLRLARRAP